MRDYVINLCEAHILYLVVDRDAGLGDAAGGPILIPYEAAIASINEGGEVAVEQGR